MPGVDALDTAALIEDVAELAADMADENTAVDAAAAFVDQGPRTLEELVMSSEEADKVCRVHPSIKAEPSAWRFSGK